MSADILHFVAVTEAPNRIRELRMQAKLSQQALGDRIGVSKVTISDLERGNMMLTLDYMQRLAGPLGVLPGDLLNSADNPMAMTAEERQFIDRLRSASPAQREQLHAVAEVIAPLRAHSEDSGEARKRA
jgi:transcriptional regulator with XRE-family HTH domain